MLTFLDLATWIMLSILLMLMGSRWPWKIPKFLRSLNFIYQSILKKSNFQAKYDVDICHLPCYFTDPSACGQLCSLSNGRCAYFFAYSGMVTTKIGQRKHINIMFYIIVFDTPDKGQHSIFHPLHLKINMVDGRHYEKRPQISFTNMIFFCILAQRLTLRIPSNVY